MRTLLTIVLIISTLGLMASETAISKSSKHSPEGDNVNSQIVTANNQFGFALFKQLQLQEQNENLFISPLSIAFALAMTYNGAAGETSQAMARTLKLDGMGLSEVNQASASLIKSLNSADPKISLSIANSLWARQGINFKEDFLARNRNFFGAEIATLNFADPAAKVRINQWVNKNTKGKIPSIIDQIDADMVLFLINAIYFKGLWSKPFDEKLTKTQVFHLPSGSQKQTPMMSQSGDYSYYRGDKFQAVSLPYGEGNTALYLFLPDKESSLKQFLGSFTFDNCEQWMKGFRGNPGDVKIPRFKMEYQKTLNETLKTMGMEVAFDRGRADFSGMRDPSDGRRLFISEVKHKAVVEVNEEGTEAAAATSVGAGITSMRPPQQRFTFIADRPFLMAIRDQKTGALLFMGAVFDPNKTD
jgi:serine protease inhibitor